MRVIYEKDVPKHDLLLAVFSSYSFILAGKRLGFEVSRGAVFLEDLRILKAKHPGIFLKNAPGLCSRDQSRT